MIKAGNGTCLYSTGHLQTVQRRSLKACLMLRPDMPEAAPPPALPTKSAEARPAPVERGALAPAPDAAATAAGGAAAADPDDEAAVCGALFRGLVFFLGREVGPQSFCPAWMNRTQQVLFGA